MKNIDEINHLNKLLEQNALTKDEYNALVRKIISAQKAKDASSLPQGSDYLERQSSQNQDSTETFEQPNHIAISNYEIRAWNSVFWSGKKLLKAKLALTIGFISTAISFFFLAGGYVKSFEYYILRGNFETNMLNWGFVLSGIFGFIAFVSWIVFLANLDSAGSALKDAYEMNKPLVDTIKEKIKLAIYKIHLDEKEITMTGLMKESGLDNSIIKKYLDIFEHECDSLNRKLKKS